MGRFGDILLVLHDADRHTHTLCSLFRDEPTANAVDRKRQRKFVEVRTSASAA